MELGLSARDRRTLIIGATSIGSLFTLARGLPAIRAWDATERAQAATIAVELADARAIARLLPVLRDSARARTARLAALDSTLVTGATPAAAAAELASTLGDLADDARVKVNAMQLRADSTSTGSLTLVGVRMTAVSDVYGLAALLRAIEGGDAPLVVRELSVTQPEPAAPSTKTETLRFELVVETLALLTQPSVK